MDYSLSDSSVSTWDSPWTEEARILEWVAISFSRGCSQPRDQTHVCLHLLHCRWLLFHWATWEAPPCGIIECIYEKKICIQVDLYSSNSCCSGVNCTRVCVCIHYIYQYTIGSISLENPNTLSNNSNTKLSVVRNIKKQMSWHSLHSTQSQVAPAQEIVGESCWTTFSESCSFSHDIYSFTVEHFLNSK